MDVTFHRSYLGVRFDKMRVGQKKQLMVKWSLNQFLHKKKLHIKAMKSIVDEIDNLRVLNEKTLQKQSLC